MRFIELCKLIVNVSSTLPWSFRYEGVKEESFCILPDCLRVSLVSSSLFINSSTLLWLLHPSLTSKPRLFQVSNVE